MTTTRNTVRLGRIMVIDDDEISNFLCDRIINLANVAEDVVTFTNASSALEFLTKAIDSEGDDLPDLILLDINMPLMNGWEFLDKFEAMLEDSEKDIAIAVLSSSVYQKDQEKASGYKPVLDYISKPLTKEGICSIVEKMG